MESFDTLLETMVNLNHQYNDLIDKKGQKSKMLNLLTRVRNIKFRLDKYGQCTNSSWEITLQVKDNKFGESFLAKLVLVDIKEKPGQMQQLIKYKLSQIESGRFEAISASYQEIKVGVLVRK